MKEKIQKLRNKTGAGVMDCKNALLEANGDMNKAEEIIIKNGSAKAEKRADRKTGAGFLEAYIHNGRIGVILELRCETDFVAKTDEFQNLAHELAIQIISTDPKSVEDLLNEVYIKDESIKISNLIDSVIARIGENIKIERFCRYSL